MEKHFKTLDEQLEILKTKGLIIDDEEYAKEILLRENYFFINGYRILLMNSYSDKTFVVGATFRELHHIFMFDRNIRNILFKNLLIIENQLKSIISYQLSKKYGYRDKDYLSPKVFTNDKSKSRRVKDVIDKMKRQIRVNGAHHIATMHYMNNYGYIPLWVLVKVLSFGIVCELFLILKNDDQVEIADTLGVSTAYLESFLPILANYRNLCAHEDILYDYRNSKIISDKYSDYKIFNDNYLIVSLNNKKGIINLKDEVILNVIYDDIGYMDGEYLKGYNIHHVIVKKDNLYGIVSYKDGKVIEDIKYSESDIYILLERIKNS